MPNPETIKWKYFYSISGNFVSSYEKPKGKKILAPLLLSRDFSDRGFFEILEKMADKGLCACLAYDPEKEDDEKFSNLAHRSSTYNIGQSHQAAPENLLPLSPEEGASQAIRAMLDGYDIIDICGGICIDQKMVLIKDYFRDERNAPPEKKIRFWGFSNGSAPMLYLGDLLQSIQCPSAANIFLSKELPKEDVDEALAKILSSPDTQQHITKNLIPLNESANKKYSSFESEENITYFAVNAEAILHNFDSEEEWSPPQEGKFILCTEGVSGDYAFSPHEAVEKFLFNLRKSGNLDRLQHVEIGDITFYQGSESKKADLERIEEEAIRKICDHYGVALVTKEGERTGHKKHIFVDPSDVKCSLKKIKEGDKVRLQQVTPLFNLELPRRPQAKKSINYGSLEARILEGFQRPNLSKNNYNPDAKETFENVDLELPVIAVNEEARQILKERGEIKSDFFGGRMYNAINSDITIDLESGMGFLMINRSFGRNQIAVPLQDAAMRGKLGRSNLAKQAPDLPFVIIAHDTTSLDPKNGKEYIKWNEAFLKKFIELNKLEGTPIFSVTESLNIEYDSFRGKVILRLKTPAPQISEAEASVKERGNTI